MICAKIEKLPNAYVSKTGKRHKFSNDAEKEVCLMMASTDRWPIDFDLFPAMFNDNGDVIIGKNQYATRLPDDLVTMDAIAMYFEGVAQRIKQSQQPELPTGAEFTKGQGKE
jgi:hypothetical protein